MADSKSRSAGLDPEFRQQLGRNLRRARLDSGMTLEEVAARFGLNTNMVWRWEAGRSAPMIDRLAQLATLYGVTPDALLSGPAVAATASGFASAVQQATAGLAQDDLELILDFARLLQTRRQRRTGVRDLPMVAETPAPYAAPPRRS